ncbi:MAG: hypothetical protein ACRC6K_05245 [Fusobacteriaceae bacterium]
MEKIIESLGKLDFMGTVIAVTGFLVGFKFPDWDFKMKLKHRNILTHSPLMILIFIYFHLKQPTEVSRYFIVGFSLAIGLHLIFDLFPKAWGGGSLIQIPIISYSCSPRLSKILFRVFIMVSLYLSIQYTHTISEYLIVFTMGIIILFRNIKKEEKFFRPLSIYFSVFLIFGSFKYEMLIVYVEKYGKELFFIFEKMASKVITYI